MSPFFGGRGLIFFYVINQLHKTSPTLKSYLLPPLKNPPFSLAPQNYFGEVGFSEVILLAELTLKVPFLLAEQTGQFSFTVATEQRLLTEKEL